jgi:PAS domain S-box-containing protein
MRSLWPHVDPDTHPVCYRVFNNPPRDGPCPNCPVLKTLQDGQMHEDIRECPEGGRMRYIRHVSSPLRDKDGRIIAAIEVGEDITQRKQTEDAVQRAKEEWESTFDSVPDLISIIDDEFHIRRVNRPLAEKLGKTPEECIGLTCFRVMHGTESPPDLCPHTLTLADDMQHVAELHVDSLGGDFLISTTPLHDSKGLRIGCVHVARDITRRKEAEETVAHHAQELASLNQQLGRSNRDLEEFSYAVSHDLQEPLRKMHMFSSFLAEDAGDKLPRVCYDHIRHVQDATSRMKTLVQHLLQLSRVGRDAQFSVVRPREALDRALGTLSERVREAGGEVTVSGDLPSVIADAVQLEQLFQNLVENAVKFHAPDRAPKVVISGDANHDTVTFSVADNGIGIESRYLDRIFGVFQRLHTRMQYEGSGIGLALCAKIVSRHGGKIWAESEVGRGSVFKFTLPHGTHSAQGAKP